MACAYESSGTSRVVTPITMISNSEEQLELVCAVNNRAPGVIKITVGTIKMPMLRHIMHREIHIWTKNKLALYNFDDSIKCYYVMLNGFTIMIM